MKDQYFERYKGLFAVLLDFSVFFFISRSQFHEFLINISYASYVLCCFVFVYCVCRPKLVVNICINWLPIIINFSVILGSQCSPILFLFLIMFYLTRQSERNKLVVVVVVATRHSPLTTRHPMYGTTFLRILIFAMFAVFAQSAKYFLQKILRKNFNPQEKLYIQTSHVQSYRCHWFKTSHKIKQYKLEHCMISKRKFEVFIYSPSCAFWTTNHAGGWCDVRNKYRKSIQFNAIPSPIST